MTRPKIIRHITDFAYRTTIGVEVFIVAGISLLLITILMISFQAIKAALANPIKSLRAE
jgi:putative ABC transport system permease protein